MPLPFDLVQKLYAAHFPYAWITWEGKLWEDPENQPNLSELIKACGEYFSSLNQGNMLTIKWVAVCNVMPGIVAREGDTPEETVADLWLSLPHPTLRPEHVDMPIELSD